jgi:hypothetical protein
VSQDEPIYQHPNPEQLLVLWQLLRELTLLRVPLNYVEQNPQGWVQARAGDGIVVIIDRNGQRALL